MTILIGIININIESKGQEGRDKKIRIITETCIKVAKK